MQNINIITHNGVFHYDEVMAYAMLNYMYPNNTLVRTRNNSIIQNTQNSIIIDVGQIYDKTLRKYDHHQASFHETFFDNSPIIMSSAGLIYKNYGMQLLKKFCRNNHMSFSDDEYLKAFNYMYNQMIIEIDAFDNGIRQYSDNMYKMLDEHVISQNYFSTASIGFLVSRFNGYNANDDDTQHVRFKEASEFAWLALSVLMKNYFSSAIHNASDYKIIENAMHDRYMYEKSGCIIVVKSDCNSWKQCVKKYERKFPMEQKAKFIVYRQTDTTWGIRALSDGTFVNRMNILPADELKKELSHPSDLVFVHNNAFLAVASTMETCIEIGILSLY